MSAASLATALLAAPAAAQTIAYSMAPILIERPSAILDASPVQDSEPRRTVLTLPVVRNGSPLGEIEVSVDASGDALLESHSLTEVISPLLSPLGLERLAQAIGTDPYVGTERLAEAGIELRFDMSSLQVDVESIAPSLRLVQELATSNDRFGRAPPTIEASDFSAYMSLAANLEYTEGQFADGLRDPDILGFGAMRIGRFALQYEGGLTQRGTSGYGLYRRFVRGIYDLEERDIRLSAGDLQAETLSIFGTQSLGGLGIERRRRNFSPFEPVFELGGRRIQVASPSTIEIVSNGQVVRTIPVDEGIYDLRELPLLVGSNDVDIVIRDAAGRTSITNFSYFYDPVDLEVGDYEYGAHIGFVSSFANLQPDYTDQIAATGFYRRAISPSLLLGGAVQLSEDIQALAGEIRWVPQFLPGVLNSELAISNGDGGVGVSARAGYRWGRSTAIGGQQFTLLADYESSTYQNLSRPRFLNERRFSVTANYGQNITRLTYVSGGVSYFERSSIPARTTIFADLSHQFRPRLRGTLGAEYGRNDGFGNSFGVRIGLTYLLGGSSRATGSYESRRDLYRASYSKALENRVGAVGYDASLQSVGGRSLADASMRYRGNRFEGRLLVSGSGQGLDGVFDTRRAQMQISTSLAFADGMFGIGRPIRDGFAVLGPHPSIDGEVVVGNRLNGGEYQARSGPLGAAVMPNILGYQTREVLYDIDAQDNIYDVGEGSDRIRVPTSGGARVVVGNFRFVSAIGTLFAGDEPVSLATGTITSQTDEGFPTGQFFTNSIGRFSIIGLAPGERYDVELRDGTGFSFEVPSDSTSILRISDINIEETSE